MSTDMEQIKELLRDFKREIRRDLENPSSTPNTGDRACKSTHILNQHEQTLAQITKKLDDHRNFWDDIKAVQSSFQSTILSKISELQFTSKLDIEKLGIKMDAVLKDLADKEERLDNNDDRLQTLEYKVTNLKLQMEDNNKKLLGSLEIVDTLKESGGVDAIKKMTLNFNAGQYIKSNASTIAAIIAALFTFVMNFDSVVKIIKGVFSPDKPAISAPLPEKKEEKKEEKK